MKEFFKTLSGGLHIFQTMEKNRELVVEWLKNNYTPEYSRYWSDYMGVDYEGQKVIAIDIDGNEYHCPRNEHYSYASNREPDEHHENGKPVCEWLAELIAEGVQIVKIRVVEYGKFEITNYEDYHREAEAFFDHEMLRIVIMNILKKLLNAEVKEVKPHGNSAHILLPKSMLGKNVLVVPF